MSSSAVEKNTMQQEIPSSRPLRILIVGGSIAGLMAGILLKRAGHEVHVIESSFASDRTGSAAGIGLSQQIKQFFDQNDRIKEVAMGTPSEAVFVMQADMTVIKKVPVSQYMTTWDAIYYRLRANFDSHKSDYCPIPPSIAPYEGPSIYDNGKRLVEVELDAERRPLAHVINLNNDHMETHTADYIIGADGANSTLRRSLLPKLSRSEIGYCIWRGTVPVSQISEEARRALDGRTVVYQLPRSYAVMYNIPGPKGSLADGDREINFAWYIRYSSDKELSQIMTDTEGHIHRTTLPRGKMRVEVWERIVQTARDFMHPVVIEIVEKITTPFVSVVASIAPDQASFMGHRVFLIGDALFQLQPNSGQGSNMAAFGATNLAMAIQKASTDLSETERRRIFQNWEYRILDRGCSERVRSVMWAHIFLRNRLHVVVWSLRLRALAWWIKVARWSRWLLGWQRLSDDDYKEA
jgi:2-polyprenyl-6-methoxyphenol hydroxylase-like FAD-dependent oxidoreductase